MKGGFADSPIRLNHYLATIDTWNESKIRHRASQLADLAIKIWNIPQVDDLILKESKTEKKVGKRERIYGLDVHNQYLKGDMLDIFQELRKRILNLDASVQEEIKRRYIAYKAEGNTFVDIIPQRKQLLLSLKPTIGEINDPKAICRDVSAVGRWGSGNIQVPLLSLDGIDYAIELVKQSFGAQLGKTD
jgi:predicted transport protein